MYFNNLSIDHLNLSVSNLVQSTKWYSHLFDFKVVEKGDNWNIIRSGNIMLCQYETAFLKPQTSKNIHKIYHFGLKISDIESWLTTLKKENFQLLYNSPVNYENSTSWYIKDPSGHEIEVVYWNNNIIRFN